MGLTTESILGWTRVSVLLLAMGWAAWMDHKDRRVGNDHWMVWIKPALFLWALDLIAQEADWTVFLTASAVVAYASTSIIGRPTFKDLLAGNRIDVLVSLWYVISLAGIIGGSLKYGDISPLDVIVGNESGPAVLWWSTLSGLFTILIIDFAWRFRLIHGGADAKALMLVAILIPSWDTMPLISDKTSDSLVALPPALALLMWGGLTFVLIPVMQLPDGSSKVYHKSRAPRRTPTDEELDNSIKELEAYGVEEVWISYKLPLLVFLFPAIIPLALLGDPITHIMPLIGL